MNIYKLCRFWNRTATTRKLTIGNDLIRLEGELRFVLGDARKQCPYPSAKEKPLFLDEQNQ